MPTGDSGIAVADGYWLMLAPMAAGEKHVINFGGGLSAFGFGVDVTANITVAPEPSTLLLCVVGTACAGAHAFRRAQTRRGVPPLA